MLDDGGDDDDDDSPSLAAGFVFTLALTSVPEWTGKEGLRASFLDGNPEEDDEEEEEENVRSEDEEDEENKAL